MKTTPTHDPPTTPPHTKISVRFGDPMLEAGHTAVPNLVLRHYAAAGITTEEMLFTIQVWSYWWDERDPYPSLEKIAERMGTSIKTVRRYSASLQAKALLTVRPRMVRGRGQTTNEYDFSRMLKVILLLKSKADADPTPQAPKKTTITDQTTTARTKLGGGHPDKTGRGRRHIPEKYSSIDQIDREMSVGEQKSKTAGSESPPTVRTTRQVPDEIPAPPIRAPLRAAGGRHPAQPTPRAGMQSLAALLETRVVIPASQLEPAHPASLHPTPPVRRAKAPRVTELRPSAQSPTAHLAPAQRGSQRATARIADFVRQLGAEYGDTRHQANISQIGGLFARSGLPEDRFLDWLYTIRSELRDYRRSHAGALITRPMAYFYTTLRRRLGLETR